MIPVRTRTNVHTRRYGSARAKKRGPEAVSALGCGPKHARRFSIARGIHIFRRRGREMCHVIRDNSTAANAIMKILLLPDRAFDR